MTIDEFLVKLREVGFKWSLYDDRIRADAVCPVCAVATHLGKNPKGYTVQFWMLDIGMDSRLQRLIASCADNHYESIGYTDLRAKLLEACGL